jgi:hypothetical protein
LKREDDDRNDRNDLKLYPIILLQIENEKIIEIIERKLKT